MNIKQAIVIAVVAVLLASVVALSYIRLSSNSNQIESKTWIFITEKDCTPKDADSFRASLINDKSIYDKYTLGTHYEVTCASYDIKNVPTIVQTLRVDHPSDKFIFLYHLSPTLFKDQQGVIRTIYSDNNHITFQLYLASLNYPSDMIPKVYGKTIVREGYSYSDYRLDVLKHEWTHLTLCAEHPEGTVNADPTTWQRVEGSYTFCE